jgi:hypothetical protein
VRIGGHWQAPSYRLDVKELLSNNKVLRRRPARRPSAVSKLLGDKADNEGEGVAVGCSYVQIFPAFRFIAMQSSPRAGSVRVAVGQGADAVGVGSEREGCLVGTKMVSLWFYQGADE